MRHRALTSLSPALDKVHRGHNGAKRFGHRRQSKSQTRFSAAAYGDKRRFSAGTGACTIPSTRSAARSPAARCHAAVSARHVSPVLVHGTSQIFSLHLSSSCSGLFCIAGTGHRVVVRLWPRAEAKRLPSSALGPWSRVSQPSRANERRGPAPAATWAADVCGSESACSRPCCVKPPLTAAGTALRSARPGRCSRCCR
jgi:hypothetical protein